MSGFGTNPTTSSQGSLATNQLPIATVAVPNAASGNLTALQGGPAAAADTNGNVLAPVSAYIYDGNDVTQGSQADTAWGGSGSGTQIAILKKLVALLSAALSVSGTITANAGTNLNTSLLALESGGNLASIKSDADALSVATGAQADSAWSGSGSGSEIAILKKIATELAATLTVSGTLTANAGTNLNTSLLALETGGNLASIKSDADAILLALGTTSDTAWSLSGNATIDAIAKKIALLLSGTLTMQQTDGSTTGTISAAQSVINTPVSNATVSLALGQGQSTWKAQLLAGGGGFTSGTTIVADKSPDGGTTWYSASFKVSGASPNTPQSSVTGPAPLELTGNASGVTHVRLRCSVLNSTETIAVTLRGSVGMSELGIISPLPAGSNLMGTVGLTAGSAVIGSSTIQATSGTALVADQSNTELRVSNYGKNSAAGDTPLLVDSTGRMLTGRSTIAAYSLASTTTTGSTQNSGDITVGSYIEIAIDINTTAQAGTSPTIQYFYERKAADGIYYVLWQSAILTAATNTLSTSIGAGMAYNQSLGVTGRIRWVIGGSATPTYTHTINIQGK